MCSACVLRVGRWLGHTGWGAWLAPREQRILTVVPLGVCVLFCSVHDLSLRLRLRLSLAVSPSLSLPFCLSLAVSSSVALILCLFLLPPSHARHVSLQTKERREPSCVARAREVRLAEEAQNKPRKGKKQQQPWMGA